MRAAGTRDGRRGRDGIQAEIVVAICTGLARLSGTIGLPLVHIDAALDADAAVQALNARQHGCAVPWPGSFQPLLIEPGWSDWKLFPLEAHNGAGIASTSGPWVADERLRVPLPEGVPLVEFRSQLAGSLRHMRLQEVTRRADFLERRCDEMADLLVPSRYTPPRAAEHDHHDAALVEDIYVLDPVEVGARLLWLVATARAAAMDGPSSSR